VDELDTHIDEVPQDDLEDDRVESPDTREVASRLLALIVMDLRCSVEARFAAGQRESVMTWAEAQGIVEGVEEHLHPIERQLLFDKKVGDWDAGLRRDVHWLIEGQAMVRWALDGLAELPPPDLTTNPGELGPGPLITPNSFIDTAMLRPEAEIERAAEVAAFWLWRARAGPFRGKRLLPPHVREAVDRAASEGVIDPTMIIDGDVVAFGGPVFQLEEDLHEILTSIATERCRAARWLVGYDEDFYEVSIETQTLFDS